MRVLVYEQFYEGHHFAYLRHLLSRLVEVVDEVVVAITPQGRESKEFALMLSPFLGKVQFDVSVPPVQVGLPLSERWRVHQNLRAAVSRVRPDRVLVPTGDPQSTVMPLFRMLALGGVPRRCPAEVGIHFGRAGMSWKNSLRNLYKEYQLLAAGWRRVHIVNFLFYEHIRRRGGWLSDRAVLLPDPIPVNRRRSKSESRRSLGIPEEGRYVGVAGLLDMRKAIPQLLAAFQSVSTDPKERLLLAGHLAKSHAQVIDSKYSELVQQGRLVVLNRFLNDEEFETSLSAMDVVCTPYPAHEGLSGMLLHGLAAGRPVLAHSRGWSRAIIRRFDVGWHCDTLDPSDFATKLRTALDQGQDYKQSEATARLLEFHSPENFAESWVTEIRATQGAAGSRHARSWEWVLDGLCTDKRALL